MSFKPLDSRQSVLRPSLPMIGNSPNAGLDAVFGLIDPELSKLYEDRNLLLVSDGYIAFPNAGTTVAFSSNLRLHINSQVAGGTPTIIDLGSTTRTVSASGTMIYAVINRVGGIATVFDNATTLPAVDATNQEVVLIAKRVDATDGTKRVYFRNGFSLTAGQTGRLGTYGDVLTTAQQTTPSNPPTGYDRLYFKADDNLYALSSTGIETQVTLIGGAALNVTTKTTTYGAAWTDGVILCNGTFTVSIPASAGNTGKLLRIKNIGTGVITVAPNGSDTIDGEAFIYLLTKDSIELIPDGVSTVNVF